MTAGAAMAYAAQRVAPHKKIRSVESVEQIPSHLPAKFCVACG